MSHEAIDVAPATSSYKDAVLDELARDVNVAQFVSFDTSLNQRFAWLHGREPNAPFDSVGEACEALLRSAESHAVNVRSFRPGDSKGHPLVYNLTRAGDVVAALRECAERGLFTIANELIPIDDGGVSGAAIGDILEFAPGDTPKCVEKPGVASLPRRDGVRMLETVYGFRPQLGFGPGVRIEFSIHPIRRGLRHEHTIIWELEPSVAARSPRVRPWPNRFSEFIGDKAYGLLVASLLGFAVPHTTVVARAVAPFSFGERTGTGETWMRTAPPRPVAGKYLTEYGWRDPFTYLAQNDPDGVALASVLAQESVEFVWSGAAHTTEEGVAVEGRPGRGDAFMLGGGGTVVPRVVLSAVTRVHGGLVSALQSVKFEWVWDGKRVWIVQLHRRPKGVSRDVIYPGEPERYIRFDPSQFDPSHALEALRDLVASISGSNVGVTVAAEIGVTSHVGDILREARIPSRLEWTNEQGSIEPRS